MSSSRVLTWRTRLFNTTHIRRCCFSLRHFTFTPLLDIFEEEENFFFLSTVRLSFFQGHQTDRFEKNFKRRDKEEEKELISSPQKSESFFESSAYTRKEEVIKRKKNIKKNEIVLRVFFCRRRVLFLSLSSAFVNIAQHIHFPG